MLLNFIVEQTVNYKENWRTVDIDCTLTQDFYKNLLHECR